MNPPIIILPSCPDVNKCHFSNNLPDTTPDGDAIYIAGNLNGWDSAGTLMARDGLAATVTLTFVYGTDGTMMLADTVLNWRNTGTCGD